MPQKGTYHYKVDLKALTATAFGDMADGLPECSGSNMFELEKAMVAACAAKSEMPGFNFQMSPVNKKFGLFTACIGTATASACGGGGGGGGAAPAAAATATATVAAPEPEEEEEDM